MREVNNFTVIGGGTAGCIAALCLKQAYPQKDVMIIESPTTGIIGVGEFYGALGAVLQVCWHQSTCSNL